MTGTIYSNSEKQEQFLVTECFFDLFLEVFRSNKSEQSEFKLEKFLGFRNKQRIVRKRYTQLCASPNLQAVHCHNRNSSPKDLYKKLWTSLSFACHSAIFLYEPVKPKLFPCVHLGRKCIWIRA